MISYYELSRFTYDFIKTREMKREMNQRYFQCKKEITCFKKYAGHPNESLTKLFINNLVSNTI